MNFHTHYHIAPQIIGLILLSLTQFIWLALGALQAGSLLPTYFLVGAVLLMAIVYLAGVRWLAIAAVKLWGVFLLLYAIIRIVIGIAARFDAIKSAHVRDATSVTYFLVSFLLLAIGLKLCVMRRQ